MDEVNAPAPEPTNAPVAEDSNPTASATVETTTSETTQPETKAQESAPADTSKPEAPVSEEQKPVEPERQPRPAQRKIQKLLEQNKQLKDELSTRSVPQVSPQVPKLSEAIAGQESVDPDTLDKLGQQVFEKGVQTARGVNSLEVQQLRAEMIQREAIAETEKEAAILPNQYPELNPDNPAYNPVLEEKVTNTYQAMAVRKDPYGRTYIDPDVKLGTVAKDLVELARASAETGKAQTTATLAKQADETAVIPNSDSPSETPFENLPLEEMEARLRAKGHQV